MWAIFKNGTDVMARKLQGQIKTVNTFPCSVLTHYGRKFKNNAKTTKLGRTHLYAIK